MLDDAAQPLGTDATEEQNEPKCNPFGTRYLTDESRVWEHNAWDNVDWSEEMKNNAHRVIEIQKQQAVDSSTAEELIGKPEKQWDAFYSQHSNNFFKDRRWLLKEFPELDMKNYPEGSTVRVLEVGCGVGNTSFPLSEWDEHRRMYLYSCDYSAVAVKVLKEHEKYDSSRMCGFVWDITEDAPEDAPAKESLDFVVCIYVLSAIHPSKARQAVDNLVSLLKPGGMLLLKDYGRFDLTQLRFKKSRYIDENLYCRGDGTLVYFFSNDELDALLRSAGLVQKANFVDKRLIVNRAKQVKMYRQWLQNKKTLLRLSCETLRFRPLFDDILSDPELVQITSDPEINGDINLVYVLLYEFLAGAGLGRASPRLRGAIYKHTKAIHDKEKLLAQDGRGVAAIKDQGDSSESTAFIPRYARINTLKWTAEEAIERLKYEDWRASCLPAYLLAPPSGSHVFDTCAAPGMKTSHVAAILGGEGKIWAMDRSEDRVETMRKILEECGVENASVFHGDFLKTDVNDKKFAKARAVRYAIVDPPCSGSGMVKRMDELTGGNAHPERLAKLRNLQAMILKHALKFPNLQRAVYSTCSIHEEENEGVVDEVLLDTYVRQHFQLASSVLPTWTHRGLDTYEFGKDCLRADPAKTLTNGFFVAVFERISSEENNESKSKKKKKHKIYASDEESIEKKRRKTDVEGVINEEDEFVDVKSVKKKNKHKKKHRQEE
ncbi:methyltransferase domain protein [Cooperia oncophora]